MGSSVVGVLVRLMERIQLSLTWFLFLLTIPLALYETERLTAGQSLWAILCIGICNWIGWTAFDGFNYLVSGVAPEIIRSVPHAKVVSAPEYDPLKGFVVSAMFKGEIIPVVLDVETSLLLSRCPTVNQGITQEMAISTSKARAIAPNTEPDSLVALYTKEQLIGFGARVRTPLGEDVLLTARHVWDAEPIRLAKRGLTVPLKDCQVLYHSRDVGLDFVMVRVPLSVWSTLKVKSARLAKAGPVNQVTVFGGQNTQELLSASGRAEKGVTPFELKHSATTLPGWSGTPLYHKGTVVGVHLGGLYDKTAAQSISNRACNVYCRFELGSRAITVESSAMSEMVHHRELDRDEWLTRVDARVPYERYEIDDDVYYYGERDFYRTLHFDDERRAREPAYRSWADRADDEESLGEPLEVFFECPSNLSAKQKKKAGKKAKPVVVTQEAAEPLNYQRAASLRGSPPLANLSSSVAMNGTATQEVSPKQVVCPSTVLECRLADLEKQVSSQHQMLLELLRRSSPNSANLDGQKEGLKPNTGPSASKLKGSGGQYVHPNSPQRSRASSTTTPKPNQGNASGATSGTTENSLKQSVRSRSRRKSTGKQVPESH